MLEIFMFVAKESAKFEAKRRQIDIQKMELISMGKNHLNLAIESGSEFDETKALLELGNIYAYTGEYDLALTYFLQANALAKQTDDKDIRFLILANLGTLKKVKLEFDEAEKYYLQAFSLAQEIKSEKFFGEISILMDDLEYMRNMDKLG
ncbi:MAG: tetratricopeptide repeat protein [Anaerolineales bacterium]|nr:tetratricopeptide repeat protein [Anaerolineales bacterium]